MYVFVAFASFYYHFYFALQQVHSEYALFKLLFLFCCWATLESFAQISTDRQGQQARLAKGPFEDLHCVATASNNSSTQWQGWFLLLNCCTLILFVLTRVAKHTHRTFFECLIALFFSLPYVNCVIAQSFEVRRTTIFQLQFAFYAWRRRRRQSQSFPFFYSHSSSAACRKRSNSSSSTHTPLFHCVSLTRTIWLCQLCVGHKAVS